MARSLTGTVVSNKGDKTIVIAIQTRKTNTKYKKQYTVTTKYIAHDEANKAQVGDKVRIVETRPISARKRFSLLKIIEKAAISESDRVENIVTKDEEATT